jgi:pre-mRNA-splicing factor ATP-dependent RNA helicase DHX38/PRP16
LTILPIYSQLPSDLQAKVFEKSPNRKVVVATNIAETSLTVDGVRYVIDSGYCKLKVYSPRLGMDSLQIMPISRANANQRKGRAGRTAEGFCYRLYTEHSFMSDMLASTVPEIQRTNLNSVVLLLKGIGVRDFSDFKFMDPPSGEAIAQSMHQLWMLGALSNTGDLTPMGRRMGRLPLDPSLSKMLFTAEVEGCVDEVLTVCAMLSVDNVFYRPKGREDECDAARERFYDTESDHVTMVNVFNQWRSHKFAKHWADRHFLLQKSLERARDVREQILDQLLQQAEDGAAKTISKCWPETVPICRSVCSGYLQNACKLRGIGEYVNLRTSLPCHLHPTSALFSAGDVKEFVIYHEVVQTTKHYIRFATAVSPYWLAEFGERFYSVVGAQSGGYEEHRRAERAQKAKANEEYLISLAKGAAAARSEAASTPLMPTVGFKKAPLKPSATPLRLRPSAERTRVLPLEEDEGLSDGPRIKITKR